MTSNLQDDQPDVIAIAQANQSLAQQQQVFVRRMERDKAIFHLQLYYGWVVLIFLPVIAVFSGIIMANYKTVPASMLTAACGVLFVDVLGLVVAAYKTLLPQRPQEERVSAVTEMPDSLPDKKTPK